MRFKQESKTLSLDVETEEILETRFYRFRPGCDAIFYLTELFTSKSTNGEREPDWRRATQFAQETMENVSFKFLAKREKKTGQVDFMFVGVNSNQCRLLGQRKDVTEADYRAAVQEFEAILLSRYILDHPKIVALEEWRQHTLKFSKSSI